MFCFLPVFTSLNHKKTTLPQIPLIPVIKITVDSLGSRYQATGPLGHVVCVCGGRGCTHACTDTHAHNLLRISDSC